MSKMTYHIQLKGYVDGWDFDRADVDDMLAQNDGKPVNVLIDSLGGSLTTGLSISAAFKNHGDVSVHFVGLNASAATIASFGAKHISIDAGAVFTFGAEPPKEHNIIVFDDFVTTGATMISMNNLLKPLGYNLVFLQV